ncbi:MAG: hypothetical protein HY242_15915 [Afipia sp.]|nr:hypothetical protein [Afipia sp.]
MKAFLTAMLVTFLSTQAFAQTGGKSRPGMDDNGKAAKSASERQKERTANEAAAKDALSKIPDSKEKYDPWKIGK